MNSRTQARDATVTFSGLAYVVPGYMPVPVERRITQYLMAYRAISAPLTDEESKTYVTVTSKDGGKFAVAKMIMLKSLLVSKMLEENPEASVVVTVEADAATLDCVFEFLDYHHDRPMRPIVKPVRGPFKDLVCEFDWNYLQTRLLDGGDERKNMNLQLVVCCANFLILEDLRLFSCAALGSLIITKKTEEEIFDLFNARDKVKPEHWEKLYTMYPFMRPKEGEDRNGKQI